MVAHTSTRMNESTMTAGRNRFGPSNPYSQQAKHQNRASSMYSDAENRGTSRPSATQRDQEALDILVNRMDNLLVEYNSIVQTLESRQGSEASLFDDTISQTHRGRSEGLDSLDQLHIGSMSDYRHHSSSTAGHSGYSPHPPPARGAPPPPPRPLPLHDSDHCHDHSMDPDVIRWTDGRSTPLSTPLSHSTNSQVNVGSRHDGKDVPSDELPTSFPSGTSNTLLVYPRTPWGDRVVREVTVNPSLTDVQWTHKDMTRGLRLSTTDGFDEKRVVPGTIFPSTIGNKEPTDEDFWQLVEIHKDDRKEEFAVWHPVDRGFTYLDVRDCPPPPSHFRSIGTSSRPGSDISYSRRPGNTVDLSVATQVASGNEMRSPLRPMNSFKGRSSRMTGTERTSFSQNDRMPTGHIAVTRLPKAPPSYPLTPYPPQPSDIYSGTHSVSRIGDMGFAPSSRQYGRSFNNNGRSQYPSYEQF
ncbi:uncharacterized protein IL334_000528 [Kwoniella shivajii]|uniref:Uncharacterized protein n=1 Tax=Kwoniella shivajii TaxID=564305 RepID=A0ABZ1CQX2_9TREE|nr:hypothetical protein IL334_000528 [Kwoniella shivajii]